MNTKISRRALLTAICQVGLGALIAACGSALPTVDSVSRQTGVSQTGAPQITPSSAPKPTKTAVLKGEVVIAVSTGSYKGWQTVAEEYIRLHPEAQVSVELQRGSTLERDRYYREQIAAGAPEMSLATVNTLSDLFAQQAFINWYPYLERENPYSELVWKTMFIPESLAFASAGAERQYMLSTELLQVLFFYNRSLAQTLGLEAADPPATFTDLAAWARASRDAGVAGYDILAAADQLDWLTRILADPWYSAPEYWELCACQQGDACYDTTKPAFPASDWRTNVHFDDPDQVDFNTERAWDAFDKEYFLGEDDPSFEPLLGQLKNAFDAQFMPADWRSAVRNIPYNFLTGRALMYPAGSYFIPAFYQAMEQLKSGKLGSLPQGRQTPTPDPSIMRAKSFELGLFPCPRQSNAGIKVQYQRTIEQPAGFWGIPRKIAAQNELEVDFVMFATTPEMVARRYMAELDAENAEGNITGLSTVMGVKLGEPWTELYAGLHTQGNMQKPHPLNMVFGGLPSTGNQRISLLADFLEGASDAIACRTALRELRQLNLDDERAIDSA